MKNIYKLLFLFSLILTLSQACQKANISNPNNVDNTSDKVENIEEIPSTEGSFVSKDLAEYAAKSFANNYSFEVENLMSGEKSKAKGQNKEVGKITEIAGDDDEVALYLVNYKDNGFAIISADKRADPILAYSEKGSMPTNTEQEVPGGLNYWLSKNVNHIHGLKAEKNSQAKTNFNSGWQEILNIERQKLPPEDGCEPTNSSVQPLLETTWGQADGYNNLAPNMGCDYPTNGRAYTGCVATAMAQIVNYHKQPNNWYDWSAMPNNTGSNETSKLMHDLGALVMMDYSCDGSGASDDDITYAFGQFGYNSATQIGYEGTNNYNDVMNELDNGRPVLFTGYEEDSFLGVFPTNGTGHAWVGDGYNSGKVCPSGSTYTSIHMNWGWDGQYDGYYAFNNFDPGDSNYNRNSEVVIQIQP